MTKGALLSSNANRILHFIKYDGISTRTELAKKLGITKGAVTAVVNDMLTKGIIIEDESTVQARTRGRSSVVLAINNNYKFALGIVVENGVLSIALSMLDGKIISYDKREISPYSYHDILSNIVDETKAVIHNNCLANNMLAGIGICVGDEVLQLIEGTDRLSRMKKDLSHALSFPIIVCTTSYALLAAHKVFSEKPILKGTVAIIRFGRVISSCYMVNCEIPTCTVARGDGFLKLQTLDETTTYERIIGCEDEGERDSLLDKVMHDADAFASFIAPEKMFIMGDYVDQFHDECEMIISRKSRHKNRPEIYFINEKTIAICGCGVVVDYLLQKYDTL